YVIIGESSEAVKEILPEGVKAIEQQEQLGTAHAVKQAAELKDLEGETLVICGDTPLIRTKTIENLQEEHRNTGFKATILSDQTDTPEYFGRVVSKEKGTDKSILADSEISEEECVIKEISGGAMIINNKAMVNTIGKVDND